MTGIDIMTHSDVILRPDPSRTVIRPFTPSDPEAFAVPGQSRAQRIVDRILSLDGAAARVECEGVVDSLDERHRDVPALLLRRFSEVRDLTTDPAALTEHQKLLIGAYFSEEYSFEAAALFNPSVIRHPVQADLPAGALRFAMSLRGIGEGHVSSVTFRIGVWGADDSITIDPPSAHAVPPRIEWPKGENDDSEIRLVCDDSREISETVLFPVAPSQSQGIEDMRLVEFVDDDGTVRSLGTYTAFSGAGVRQELMEAIDFNAFVMRPLRGPIADAKGMALFPRRIDGKYVMLGRQDNENIWLITSDDLYEWGSGVKIVTPRFPWEYVQMGNCGSPIELDEGWLVITHGVGTVRNYCMGACLLDKADPTKLLARTSQPIVRPSPKARDGYVPNVVYSCGALVRDRRLLLPYGVADDFATFATVGIDDLLAAMA